MAIQNIDLGTVVENGEDGDVARTAFTKVNENFDDLDARVTYIESLDIGTVTSVNDVLPVDGNVDLTPADIGAATAAQGAKADTAVQADVFATALNQKVDKVEGYQLSQEDYTTDEKNKLANLESSLFLGVYSSLAELEAAHPTSDRPGEYAFIPSGGNIYMFVWDVVTERWVTIGTGSEAITAEQVKILYESNPNTNAFTDADVSNLSTALTTANNANDKVDSVLTGGAADKGAGVVPYNETLEYPEGSVGAAVKSNRESPALRSDLAQQTDPVKGAGLVGYGENTAYPDGTVGARLSNLSLRVITPEQYGAVGDGVNDDTNAWVEACAAIQSGYTLKASGNYSVSGSNILVIGVENFTLDLDGARLHQKANNSKTIRIEGCSKFSVKGGTFYGRGGAAGEYISQSTSYNGVAGIFLSQCDYVQIYNNRLFDHAGGSIVWRDSDHLFIHDNEITGIGPTYIPRLGNGQDFAIGGFSDNPSRMDFTFNISNNLIRDTAFGIFANRSKSFVISGNNIERIPGQHGIYTIECSGVSVTGNSINDCAQSAFKMQLENYAGRSLAPAGSLNHTGLSYTGNTVSRCQDGFAILSTSLSDGTDQKVFGVVVCGNSISECSQDGIQINHCVAANLNGNTIDGTIRFGLVFRNSSGVISDNQIVESGASAISGSLYGDTTIIDNKFIDCGLNNLAGAGNDVPILISVPVSPLPSASAAPALRLYDNDILFESGTTPSAYTAYILHTSVRLRISGTKTNSGKVVRFDGTLVRASDNDFPGFFAGAQNSPGTFLRGRMGRDFYGQQNPQVAGSTETFIRGDVCWNSNVLSTGVVFWVCTASGAPGTWATGLAR